MKVQIKNDRIILYGETYPHLSGIRQIPTRKFNRKSRIWSFQYNQMVIDKFNEIFPDLDIPLIPIKDVKDVPASSTIIPLYNHQKISVNKARNHNFFADLSQPGSGKTRVQIEMILERNTYPILIICPKSIMEAVWMKQLKEFGLHSAVLEKGSQKIKEFLKVYREGDNEKTILIINYESVPIVLPDLLKVKFKYVILDESTKIKSPTAKRSKAIMQLKKGTQFRSIMTGTLAPNGMLDAFNQFRFVDDRIFGNLYYGFREMYFRSGGYENYEWFPKPMAEEQFAEKIKPISVQHKKRDCIDLPPLTHENRILEMNTKQAKYYKEMKDDLLIYLETEDEEIVASFVITKLMKLRQIASGFIYHDDHTYEFNSPKIPDMINLIEQVNDRIIIFTHFKSSAIQISMRLKDAGINSCLFASSASDIEKKMALDMFENHKDYNILIANAASAGHGLNLQFCSNIIYYEHDFNLETYEQSWQRIERIGQKNKMTIYHLLMKDTIEPYILKKLNHKIDINKKLDINELKRSL